MSTIQSGIDPTAGLDETGITVREALDIHLAERELRPRTVHSYEVHMATYLKPLRRKAVTDITRQECRELMERLKTRHGRTSASNAMRTLRAIINTAMRIDETIASNPVLALRIPPPPRRKVEALDIAAWWKDTDAISPLMRDLHRTMLLTGARRTSVLTLHRSDVDLETGILTFRHQKTTDEPLLFPMGPYLVTMLKQRMIDDEPLASEWLWPSPYSAKGYIAEPKRKGLPSPHELRHHARTLMIAAKVPYAESALLLGHRLPGASGGYVHPEHLVEALRPYAEAYEQLVLSYEDLN